MLHLFNSFPSLFAIGRFRDNAHDRFGVARPRVHPCAIPVDADPILRIDFFAGKFFLDRLDRAVEALKKEFAHEKVDTQDGIRIDWDRAWVHARPSNTEPIMRIIAEAPDRATAEGKIAAVQAVVDGVLKG